MSIPIQNLLNETLTSLTSLDNIENEIVNSNNSSKQLYEIQVAKLGVLNASSSIFDILKDIRVRESKIQDLLNVGNINFEAFDDISSNIANNKRMIQINAYYSKKYTAYIKLLKLIILFCMPIIIISFFKKLGIITTRIAMFLIILNIMIGAVYIGFKYIDIRNRNNIFFDKYNVKLPKK